MRKIVMCNWIDSEEYRVSKKAGAFLQCDHEDYILVEFWRKDFEEFIMFENKELEKAGASFYSN